MPLSKELSHSERVRKRKINKFEAKRDELAMSAIHALSEVGYASASLRVIARSTAYSHGVFHYYFEDKADLLLHCVLLYKEECIQRYDGIVATARDAVELRSQFSDALVTTMREDTVLHRLWYNIRNQALFEPAFRSTVAQIDANLEAMIWRIVSRYAQLLETACPATPRAAYAIFDGLFERGLLAATVDEKEAGQQLKLDACNALDTLFFQASAQQSFQI